MDCYNVFFLIGSMREKSQPQFSLLFSTLTPTLLYFSLFTPHVQFWKKLKSFGEA